MNKRKPKQQRNKSKNVRNLRHLNLEYPSSTTATTQTKTRNFDYQTITKSLTELTGTQKRKIILYPSPDVKQFRNIRLCKQPNSFRTLIPELSPDVTNISHRKKSPNGLRLNATSHNFSYISNVFLSPSTKKLISKYHRSNIDFTYKSQYQKTKPSISINTQYEKYTHTTQIVCLPGGLKRMGNDINDSSMKQIRECSEKKMLNEHCSNIACLPGSRINTMNLRPLMRLFSQRTNYTIFNLQTETTRSQKRMFSPSNYNTSTASTRSALKRSSSRNKSSLERFE